MFFRKKGKEMQAIVPKGYGMHVPKEYMGHKVGQMVIDSMESKIFVHNGIYLQEGQFANHNRLKRVELENGITMIPSHCFSNCSGLKEVVLPSSIKSIGEAAFQNCKNLTYICLNNVEEVKEFAFSNTHITVLNLPNVHSIGIAAFSGCQYLMQVMIGNNLCELNPLTFNQCSRLRYVELPDRLKSIGFGCFQECKNITQMINLGNVSAVDDKAFLGCIVSNVRR